MEEIVSKFNLCDFDFMVTKFDFECMLIGCCSS